LEKGVEALLVQETVVVVLPRRMNCQRLVAYVANAEQAPPSVNCVAFAKKLPDYMLPSALMLLEAILGCLTVR